MANSYSVTSGMSTEEYHRAQLAGNIVKSDAQIEAEENGLAYSVRGGQQRQCLLR